MAETNDGEMEQTVGSRPVPDPTVLTDKAIAKAAAALEAASVARHDQLTERINGIDKATELRLKTIDEIPAEIIREVSHLELLQNAKIDAERRFNAASVAHLREVDDIRFQAAERLAGRESELNALALAAAFAAQKEASAKEAEYTRIASIKAESATAQAIDKLGELFATQTRAQGDKVDDLKDRVGSIESVKAGSREGASDSRERSTDTRLWIVAAFGFIGVIAAIIFGILAAFHI